MSLETVGSLFQLPKLFGEFAATYAGYRARGTTSPRGYRCMRELYCLTNGRFNDALGKMATVLNPPYDLGTPSGVLGDLGGGRLEQVTRDLQEDGFHVFERRLPLDTVRALSTFARTTPCSPMKGWERLAPTLYDEKSPASVKYDFDYEVIVANQLVQSLVTDLSLLSVAQAYLGAKPVIAAVAMWWSTGASRVAVSEAAQLFHFDLDYLNFLKFFFYLTDVGPSNGPHCFIRGSHVRKPRSLLRIERISDEEIARHYAEEEILELVGPQGTCMAVDTRGFHKGVPVREGHRLILQIELAISLYGVNSGRVKSHNPAPDLLRAAETYPFTYSGFQF